MLGSGWKSGKERQLRSAKGDHTHEERPPDDEALGHAVGRG